MKREPIFFLCVLVLLAWMGMNLHQDSLAGSRGNRRTALNLDMDALGSLNPVVSLPGESVRKNAFKKPSTDEALPPLELAIPPLAALPVLLPPPYPDPGASVWSHHLLVNVQAPVGGIQDLVSSSVDSEEVSSKNVASEMLGSETSYESLYDSVQVDTISTLWGWVLDEDRYQKGAETSLTFQEVNPVTGESRFASRVFAPGEYVGFQLAKTLQNEVKYKAVELAQLGTAREEQIHQGVSWLLNQGVREPAAFEIALARATSLAEVDPAESKHWLLLGSVYERTLQLDRAFSLYAALAGRPIPQASVPASMSQVNELAHPSVPLVRMAVILRKLGSDSAAHALLADAVLMRDGDPSADLEMGILLLDEESLVQAKAHLLQAQSLLQAQRTSLQYQQAVVGLGKVALATGDWASATSSFEDALAAVQGADSSHDAQCGLIASLYLAGKFDQAALASEEAILIYGPSASLLYLRGLSTAASGGSAAEVVRDLKQAVAAEPLDAAPSWAALAFWYDILGESALAEESLSLALEMEPSLLYAKYLEGLWQARGGNTASARDAFRGLVAEAPQCAAFLMELGWILSADGHYGPAEVAFRQAETHRPSWVRSVSHAPAWAELALRRGLNHMKRQSYGESATSFEEAQSLFPGFLQAQNAVACLQYAQGDLASSVAEFSYLLDTLRDDKGNPQAAFAQLWQGRITAHARLRHWKDTFEGNRFLSGWDAQSGARQGVEPRIAMGILRIQGPHREAGKTRAVRTLPAQHFRSFSADIKVGEAHRGDAGVFTALESRNGRQTWAFHVFRDREGWLSWSWKQGAKEDRGRTGQRLSTDETIRVGFDLDREPVPPVLRVHADGQVIWTGPVAVLRSASGSLVYGVYAETANALPVDLSLDNLEVIYAKP